MCDFIISLFSKPKNLTEPTACLICGRKGYKYYAGTQRRSDGHYWHIMKCETCKRGEMIQESGKVREYFDKYTPPTLIEDLEGIFFDSNECSWGIYKQNNCYVIWQEEGLSITIPAYELPNNARLTWFHDEEKGSLFCNMSNGTDILIKIDSYEDVRKISRYMEISEDTA
ncbi:hypothetical protein ACPV5G_18505 [Photobacterium damselae]|uniref:hypothetical protein n=1 Tax=Photobacterium damselae TaxID=38293 RepID=UPI0040695480